MLLQENLQYRDPLKSSEIDTRTDFIDFLKIGGAKSKFLGPKLLLGGSQRVQCQINPGKTKTTQANCTY